MCLWWILYGGLGNAGDVGVGRVGGVELEGGMPKLASRSGRLMAAIPPNSFAAANQGRQMCTECYRPLNTGVTKRRLQAGTIACLAAC